MSSKRPNPHPGSHSLADPPHKGEGKETVRVTKCDSPTRNQKEPCL